MIHSELLKAATFLTTMRPSEKWQVTDQRRAHQCPSRCDVVAYASTLKGRLSFQFSDCGDIRFATAGWLNPDQFSCF